MSVVRTVLGDIVPEKLGPTDYHEHLFQALPSLAGDELDDLERSLQETVLLKDAGIDALVDLTPLGLGRDPAGLTEIAKRSGMHVVAATGVHREAHYGADHWIHRLEPEDLVRRFERELTDAFDGSQGGEPVRLPGRAGVIKVGTSYWHISDFERKILECAGEAHRRTGAPVVCHLELGTAAWEVADMLEQAGVPRDRLALAHMDRNPDPGLHAELAASGLYLGYDGPARTKYRTDAEIIACLLATAERAGSERFLLGGDVARRSSFVAHGGLPGMAYLPERFIPRLAREGGEALVDQILVHNPATFLTLVDST